MSESTHRSSTSGDSTSFLDTPCGRRTTSLQTGGGTGWRRDRVSTSSSSFRWTGPGTSDQETKVSVSRNTRLCFCHWGNWVTVNDTRSVSRTQQSNVVSRRDPYLRHSSKGKKSTPCPSLSSSLNECQSVDHSSNSLRFLHTTIGTGFPEVGGGRKGPSRGLVGGCPLHPH